jgi:hypothetical protein
MDKHEIIDRILENDEQVINDVVTELIINAYNKRKEQSASDNDPGLILNKEN